MRVFETAVAVVAAAALSGCATSAATSKPNGAQAAQSGKSLPKGLDSARNGDPFASTYRPLPSRPTALVGATIFTGTGERIENGTVLIRDGRIEQVGAQVVPPASYDFVDAAGKFVTPGLIDAHSHLGVYPSPAVPAHSDGNELTDPNTAGVWAEHSVWPQDPGFNLARAGGVTTILVLPGSGNLIGGRSVTLRNIPARTVQDMKFPARPMA
jgi:Imidazolonepropionase and related amidohydrolases